MCPHCLFQLLLPLFTITFAIFRLDYAVAAARTLYKHNCKEDCKCSE